MQFLCLPKYVLSAILYFDELKICKLFVLESRSLTILQKANGLSPVPTINCNETFFERVQTEVRSLQICAIDPDGKKDSCQVSSVESIKKFYVSAAPLLTSLLRPSYSLLYLLSFGLVLTASPIYTFLT